MSVEATCPTNGITIPADEGDRSPVQKGMDATNTQVSDIAAQLGRSGRENMPIQRARDALNNPADDGLFCYGAVLQVFSHRW